MFASFCFLHVTVTLFFFLSNADAGPAQQLLRFVDVLYIHLLLTLDQWRNEAAARSARDEAAFSLAMDAVEEKKESHA